MPLKNCKAAMAYARRMAWMAGLMIAVSAQALDTLPLLPSGAAQTLLEKKKPIRAEAAGTVPAEYGAAMLVFESPSLLTDVQAAYASLLPDGEKPEFLIQQAAPKAWFYINRKGERTDITEIARKQTSDTAFDIIYYSAGKRFFGDYQAVIHVQISKDAEQSRYAAMVYAYPENAFSRFFARRLGLVERFFKKKTAEMSGIISTITCNLCEKEEERAASGAVSSSEDTAEL
jgi:hypothetical protein